MPKKNNPKGKKVPTKPIKGKSKPITKSKPKAKKFGTKVYWMVYRVVAQAAKEEKITWNYKKIRKFTSEKVFPYFKGQDPNKLNVADIKAVVYSLIGKSSEFYNPLLIPTATTTGIFWFDLDEFLDVKLKAEVDPLNLRFAVDGGTYGNTGIMNIKEYEFYTSGLQQIYEDIRGELENTSDAEWSGIAVLRDGYKDDGKTDSYYLRFTLFINGQEIPPSMEQEVGTSKADFGTFEDRKKKRKAVITKQKDLAQKRKELEKQKKIKETFLPTKKVRKSETPDNLKIAQMRGDNIQNALKEQRELLADSERLFKEGIFTKEEFIAERKQIMETYKEAIKRFEKGGEL
jgi:hypothetical protein